jgi:Raf kinase inhibitor-like YbhB/YbcL family protein
MECVTRRSAARWITATGTAVLAVAGGYALGPHAVAQDDVPDASEQPPPDEDGSAMLLESPAFDSLEAIPRKYTCEGLDVSPALHWSGVPDETQSLVLIVDDPDAPDPDAPRVTFVHWLVFNIPTTAPGLSECGELPAGAEEGENDFGRTRYGGPCPPTGRHRYFFKLYALDARLNLDRPTKAELEAAMEGHVLSKTELVGTYEKSRSARR